MRIIHVITRWILGGAQENTLLTVRGLQHDFGEDVLLVTGPPEGPEGDLFRELRRWNLKWEVLPELVRPIRPFTDWSAYRKLRRLIRERRPEVVHTHSSKAGISGRAAAWAERVPAVVHTIHGLPFGPFVPPARNALYIALERWAARRCHALVGVCDAMRDQALAAGVGRPEMYRTVYSGMEVDAFLDPSPGRGRRAARQALGFDDDHVVFATVARLFELKGHDDILDIAPEVLREAPRARFLFVGDGVWRERLRARAEAFPGRFVFTGLVPREGIPELLAASDVVLHPSYREGLARVLPQGFIAGKPAISYDVDGAREVVLPETGRLVPPGDRDALRQAVVELALDPEARRRMGAEGRRRFTETFRHETMTRSLHTLYEELLTN